MRIVILSIPTIQEQTIRTIPCVFGGIRGISPYPRFYTGNKQALRILYLTLYNYIRCKERRLKNCWGVNGWKWGKILSGVELYTRIDRDMILQLKDVVLAVDLCNRIDSLKWRWSWSESFTVKSAYNFLKDGGVKDKRFTRLWTIKVPLKIKIFIWLVLRGRVRPEFFAIWERDTWRQTSVEVSADRDRVSEEGPMTWLRLVSVEGENSARCMPSTEGTSRRRKNDLCLDSGRSQLRKNTARGRRMSSKNDSRYERQPTKRTCASPRTDIGCYQTSNRLGQKVK